MISSMVGSRHPIYISFVKFNVFVCVIRYQNIDRCFPFYVMNAVNNVYVLVSSFCGIFIIDNISHMCFNCLTCDFNWHNIIVSQWDLKGQLNNAYCSLLLTISCIC